MNERIKRLLEQSGLQPYYDAQEGQIEKFAELILQDMHRKVIASILITDVVMEAKGQVPTSEDYIRAIHIDFGVN